jgi:hypothetical protein
MASKTRRTKVIRKKKQLRRGVKRKAALRNKGTTPKAKALFQD